MRQASGVEITVLRLLKCPILAGAKKDPNPSNSGLVIGRATKFGLLIAVGYWRDLSGT